MNRFFCFLCFVAFAALLGGNIGCSRQYYRTKADCEVYSILKQGNNDSRWKVDNYRITPDSTSRMFDPFCPDKEPMPVDDPVAHKKMHNIAGMQGTPDWHENGQTKFVENPCWRQYLLVNEKGEIPLDKEQAVELSILHSPEYQSALENLYFAAAKVSQERFRYDVQFFGGDSILFTALGKARTGNNTIQNDANIEAQKLLATGGEWVVGLANSITWVLSGESSWRAESLFNVGFVQPLLRGASRKVVLESLTQSERDFLSAIRQMVLYQQGHYTRVVTGVGRQTIPTGTNGAENMPSFSGGFYGLLAEQIRIQNQRQNIIGLEENLNRFIEMFDAGQLDNRSQVEETHQTLLNSQSSLLTRINSYQANIETYIRSLGLPPDLKVNISDPLLEQFQFTSPTLIVLMEDVAEFLAMIRKKEQSLSELFREDINDFVQRAKREIAVLEQDLETLQKSVPERLKSLKNLESFLADRIESGERIDPSIYDTENFEKRIAQLRTEDIPKNLARLQASFTLFELIANTEEQSLRKMIRERSYTPAVQKALEVLTLNEKAESISDLEILLRQQELEKITRQLQTLQETFGTEIPQKTLKEAEAQKIIAELRLKDEYRDWIRRAVSVFQYELVSLSLMQTRTRLDAMTLVPVSLTSEEAFQIASENRLDWMNHKSQLVDAWRKIDIAADNLKGELNLTLNGEIGTVDRRGVHFGDDNSRLRVGVEWDSPLTRHNQMLDYRRSQIAYQNARRNYYMYVDSIQAELRNILRDVQMRQIEFEINRNAVLVGAIRVDGMQLQMEQPPQRGGRIDINTSQRLISALDGFMTSQNNFLNTWVAYQTLRMLLDLNMGTMALDSRGHWIDSSVSSSEITDMPELAPQVPMIKPPHINRRYVETK